MIALWCNLDEDDPNNNKRTALIRAAQAGLQIQDNMHKAELAEGVTLSVKVGIGVGRAQLIFVGNMSRVEYLVTGDPLKQSFGCASSCELCSHACRSRRSLP